MTLDRLLQQTVERGANELRLLSGRGPFVVMDGLETEIEGEALTLDSIRGLLSPTVRPGASQALGLARTQWRIRHHALGQMLLTIDPRDGGAEATIVLEERPRGEEALDDEPFAETEVVSPERLVENFAAEDFAAVMLDDHPAGLDLETIVARNRYHASSIAGIDEFPASLDSLIAEAIDSVESSGRQDLVPSSMLEEVTTEEEALPLPRGSVGVDFVEPPLHPGPVGEMESLLIAMFRMGASDLHLSVDAPPMIRLDGRMETLEDRSVLTGKDTERLLTSIVPAVKLEEFRRRKDTDFAFEIEGMSRFRCNYFMDRNGMGGVFRTIPNRIMTAEEMRLSEHILQLCSLGKGLVLITGPTGSGKSTTLCALIDFINRTRKDHIVTIEDPIEFVHKNNKCLINQREVGEHTDSFKTALRAALREDPDIVLVGEMRDLETVSIALETAETGHLVFGTLHTSSAMATVDRIIDQFPADQQDQIRVMLADSLKGVVSQMLCRRITGGRIPAVEVMLGTPSISNLIREGKIFQIPSIIQTSKGMGMCLMNDSLLDLVRRKIVAPEEAYSKAVDKASLLAAFKRNGISTSWGRRGVAPDQRIDALAESA